MDKYDIIVAGAGIWGCTVARCLAEAGKRVMVLEKRNVIGGNSRAETDPATGIEIHSYGAHIFHTHHPEVWAFVNRFVSFNGYQHKVMAAYNGRTYFLPLGLTLVNQFYGLNLKPSELGEFIRGEAEKAGISGEPKNFEEQAIKLIGEPLYKAFIREYTRKQWGTDPKNLNASIIKRLPVRSSYDINYYTDYWQGIPSTGYNSLFERLLDHENITVQCGIGWSLDDGGHGDVPVFYSGAIDALFGYKYGALPWRTVRFEYDWLNMADYQGTSVMNYVGADVPYTRIHEFKHFHPENKDIMALGQTIIAREYPKSWEDGDEPYYVVDNSESRALLAKYQTESAKYPNLIIGGRLGEYKYYDMDMAVKRALETVSCFLGGR